MDGKAELINGEIVILPLSGAGPSLAAGEIAMSLHAYSQLMKSGRPMLGSVAYVVALPTRESFCPDVSYYTGPPMGMKFLQGAPLLAVEIREESDYGQQAEHQIAGKRRDYFAAGHRLYGTLIC